MKAHIHKVDLSNVKELYEVRIFENDSDVENCMELEEPYQGCKIIRVLDDGTSWVPLMHGVYSRDIFKQVRDFLQTKCDMIQWSGNGQIRNLRKKQ